MLLKGMNAFRTLKILRLKTMGSNLAYSEKRAEIPIFGSFQNLLVRDTPEHFPSY
ncbi:MAG: hypothetical protein RBG13Loki_4062 [Promethearchaeota archaeon CR_4]|nr:MAG: hypothetical protein RBG13Loki_4062 [Candidatus Lokiarchaeota archaeon CR_4]